MDTRRIRRTPLPALAAVALTGTLLTGCGSDSSDDDTSDGTTASVLLHPAAGASAAQLDGAAAVLRKRLEYAGVKNGKVAVENGTIKVTVPDREGSGSDALRGIEKNGRLEFRPVLSAARLPAGTPTTPSPSAPSPSARNDRRAEAPAAASTTTPQPFDMTAGAEATPQTADPAKYPGVTPELMAAYQALDCTRPGAGTADDTQAPQVVVACEDKPNDGTIERYLLAPAELTGADVQSAQAQTPPAGQAGGWEIALNFTTSGAAKFTSITGKLANNSLPTNRFAITLDGRVVIAPSVMQELTGGQAVITGQFTKAEATRTAAVLRTGSLPVALTADPVVTNSAK